MFARDLLQSQESLSGSTSEQYLNDLQTAARVYQHPPATMLAHCRCSARLWRLWTRHHP